jgi:hypothetical protein
MVEPLDTAGAPLALGDSSNAGKFELIELVPDVFNGAPPVLLSDADDIAPPVSFPQKIR